MGLSLIVAYDKKRAIGKNGKIPWYIPDDLKFFKTMTVGKTIVMGRRTFESIGSKPLSNRVNIVLSSNHDRIHKDIIQTDKTGFVTDYAKHHDVVICGGAEVYAMFLPLCERLYVTEIDTVVGGDTFFPPIDTGRWSEVSSWDNTYPMKDGDDLNYVIKVFLKR